MSDDSNLPPGWLERQLEDAAQSYRAIEFARKYPEIVNAMADELGFVAPEPQI